MCGHAVNEAIFVFSARSEKKKSPSLAPVPFWVQLPEKNGAILSSNKGKRPTAFEQCAEDSNLRKKSCSVHKVFKKGSVGTL